MLFAAIMLGIIVYANIGVWTGHRIDELGTRNKWDETDLLLATIGGGALWPILLAIKICTISVSMPKYVAEWRKKKQAKVLEAKVAVKALPPPGNVPVNEAQKLNGLHEKNRGHETRA